ncbi:MAG: hypothetical protein Q8Q12_09915 [bacterium]|nr:hypothetical protein [bacterium]
MRVVSEPWKARLYIVPLAYNGKYDVYKESSEQEPYIFGERYGGAQTESRASSARSSWNPGTATIRQ